VWLRKDAGHVIPAKAGISMCGFADIACPEPAVLRVQWIPACSGMTIMPVRVRNLITPSFAGTTK
jgi:hypothetical protein